MRWFIDMITNPFLIIGTSSFLLAQLIKCIIHAIITKHFDIRRLFGDGGMPSSHSATVASLAVLSGFEFGFSSFTFAMVTIFASIVCHDAAGVRRETGKQAVLLNEIVNFFEEMSSSDQLPEVKLKEFVGHTHIQVCAGVLFGILNAVVMYNLFF